MALPDKEDNIGKHSYICPTCGFEASTRVRKDEVSYPFRVTGVYRRCDKCNFEWKVCNAVMFREYKILVKKTKGQIAPARIKIGPLPDRDSPKDFIR